MSTGADILIRALEHEGVDVMFGVPGGAILPAYDPILASPIRHILARHEQGAGHMAEGYAWATGRVGVCIATSGPGATNLVTPLADALIDSVPLVAITGQVPTHAVGNDAFQEAYTTGITMPATKHNYFVTEVEEIPDIVHEAFHIAATGRPGPVLVDVPKDVLNRPTTWREPSPLNLPGYKPTSEGHPKRIREAVELIATAQRPGPLRRGRRDQGRRPRRAEEIRRAGQRPGDHHAHGARRHPRRPPAGAWYAGDARHLHRHHRPAASRPADRHRCPIRRSGDRQPSQLRSRGQGDPCRCRSGGDRQGAGRRHPHRGRCPACPRPADRGMGRPPGTRSVRVARDPGGWQRRYPLRYEQRPDGPIKPQFVVEELHRLTGGDAVLVAGVGQHQMWASQFWRFTEPRRWINSGGLGTMGFAVPAAIGAKAGRPDEVVYAIDGDGCFQMTLQELITAATEEIPIKVGVINNGAHGMVKQWQKLFYGGRLSASLLGDVVDYPSWPRRWVVSGSGRRPPTRWGQPSRNRWRWTTGRWSSSSWWTLKRWCSPWSPPADPTTTSSSGLKEPP